MPAMAESDRTLLQHVLEQQHTLTLIHREIARISEKLDGEVARLASRQAEIEKQADASAQQIIEWRAQRSLILGVFSFLGVGGVAAVLAVLLGGLK